MVGSKSGGSMQEVAVMANWKLTAGVLFMPVAKTGRSPPLMGKSASETITAWRPTQRFLRCMIAAQLPAGRAIPEWQASLARLLDRTPVARMAGIVVSRFLRRVEGSAF